MECRRGLLIPVRLCQERNIKQMKEATKRLISNETSLDRSTRLKDAAPVLRLKYQMKHYKKDL
jgi:hypothetical protein